MTSRQWFVKTLEHREELLRRGEELRWHPEFMKHRYRSWVEGLNVDWNISRQRFFGVPFPVWYPVDEARRGRLRPTDRAERERLPIDPSSHVPTGFEESQRNQPLGFSGDPDVMDTWATSSLSPQIAGHWGSDLFDKVFPDGRAPPGARDHPHVALLDRSAQRPRARQPALQERPRLGLGPRPQSEEDEQVRRQRRDTHAAARTPRRRRPALLGGLGSAGYRHRGRRGADEDRSATRHQGPQRLEVRARPTRRGDVAEPE